MQLNPGYLKGFEEHRAVFESFHVGSRFAFARLELAFV